MKSIFGIIALSIAIGVPIGAQPQTQLPGQPQQAQTSQPSDTTRSTESALQNIRPTYVLGSGDQISIRAFEVEEISDKPYRIDTQGNINLPLLGPVHPDGMTVEQFEADLMQRLKALVKQPQVVVTVVQFRSEPVFFEGLFKAPGIYPLQGRRNLIEMLTAIGGTQPNASHRITVTRRLEFGKIPLPNAVEDPEKNVSSVEISLGSLRENVNPAENIALQPYDRISVERAEMIYVSGEVGHVGGIELGERDSISVTQLITMVGGLGRDAAGDKARVLRPILNTARRSEIPVNIKRILEGKENDFPLLPNDVLVVPRSSGRVAWGRVLPYLIPIASSVLITVLLRY